MESNYAVALPLALAAALVSVFTVASYIGGDNKSDNASAPPRKRQRSSSLTGTSANNAHSGEGQNYLPSATRNGLASLQLGGDLHDVGSVLANSPNRRRQTYSNINSRYPLTGRMGHVVEVIDDLRQLQRETETALEQQCQQTEQERQLRCRMEKSLQAESQLREDAEASIQLYKDLITQLKAEKETAVSNLSERNTRIKSVVATITSMISENSLTSENADMILQLVASLSRE